MAGLSGRRITNARPERYEDIYGRKVVPRRQMLADTLTSGRPGDTSTPTRMPWCGWTSFNEGRRGSKRTLDFHFSRPKTLEKIAQPG
jgi:hypothetical protein